MADHFAVAIANDLLAVAVIAAQSRLQANKSHHVHIVHVWRQTVFHQAQRITLIVVHIRQAHRLDVGMADKDNRHSALFTDAASHLANTGMLRRNVLPPSAISAHRRVKRFGLAVFLETFRRKQFFKA